MASVRSISPMVAATIAVLIASVLGETVAARENSSEAYIFASAAFAGAVLRLAWQLNRPWWQDADTAALGPSQRDVQPQMAVSNARLIALCYAWGGTSLLAVYLLSPLRWQHGWQYGAGMCLIALLITWGSPRLVQGWTPQRNRWTMAVSLIHGWAATAGLGWMVGIGKIYSPKGDWAANIVFVAGGLMLVSVTILALRTARFLNSPPGAG